MFNTLFRVKIITIISLLFVIIAPVNASVNYTYEEYWSFLKSTDLVSYNKFINLTDEQKDIFMSYINNPDLLNSTVVKYVSDVTLKLIHKSFWISIITKEFWLVGWMYWKIEHWAINK